MESLGRGWCPLRLSHPVRSSAAWGDSFRGSQFMADRQRRSSCARTATRADGKMYLDSSIIVKLLVREADSDYFNSTLPGQALDSSELCLTEVYSAILSKEAAGGIS